MKLSLKDISAIVALGIFFISAVSAGAVLKKNVDESKQKIEKLESSQINYAVQQGKVEEKLENLEEQNKELKQEIKEQLKEQSSLILEAIRSKKK